MHTNATVYPHNSDNSNNTVTAFGDSFVIKKTILCIAAVVVVVISIAALKPKCHHSQQMRRQHLTTCKLESITNVILYFSSLLSLSMERI